VDDRLHFKRGRFTTYVERKETSGSIILQSHSFQMSELQALMLFIQSDSSGQELEKINTRDDSSR
jgi:hypothetical protein